MVEVATNRIIVPTTRQRLPVAIFLLIRRITNTPGVAMRTASSRRVNCANKSPRMVCAIPILSVQAATKASAIKSITKINFAALSLCDNFERSANTPLTRIVTPAIRHPYTPKSSIYWAVISGNPYSKNSRP
eukprot:COSAG01_NODE_427_length_17198_cov_86.960173_10_plen_132_part_00